jgi:hypothetical protein
VYFCSEEERLSASQERRKKYTKYRLSREEKLEKVRKR